MPNTPNPVRPRTLRQRDFHLSGENSLGYPVLGPEDYWSRVYDLFEIAPDWCSFYRDNPARRIADAAQDFADSLDRARWGLDRIINNYCS